jgi:hypothetical protein
MEPSGYVQLLQRYGLTFVWLCFSMHIIRVTCVVVFQSNIVQSNGIENIGILYLFSSYSRSFILSFASLLFQ